MILVWQRVLIYNTKTKTHKRKYWYFALNQNLKLLYFKRHWEGRKKQDRLEENLCKPCIWQRTRKKSDNKKIQFRNGKRLSVNKYSMGSLKQQIIIEKGFGYHTDLSSNSCFAACEPCWLECIADLD